jgi:2-polyprenyl-3-methyl-5-hydroxy-6-metoxy-1,4-benzoquinol methylase
MTADQALAIAQPPILDGLENRLISSAVAALELFSIHIGRDLGLYGHLAGDWVNADDLAARSGIESRYAREWLEQQAVAGFVWVDNPHDRAGDRRYRLTAHGQAVFTAPDHPSHVSPIADMVAGVGQTIGEVIDAYRTGDGVAFTRFGEAMRDGQGGINRPAFTHDLVDSWIPAVRGLPELLGDRGRIADLGCGVGWSTIAMALGFPGSDVVGFDNDRSSIETARLNARRLGADVRFKAADASVLAEDAPFDLVTILEALHDMAQPAAVLEAARGALRSGGTVLIADEKVADHFTAPGDEMERMMYGWSVSHCLPAAMSEQPSAGIGTVIREPVVRDLALQAGFESVEVLDIDAGFFRLYVVR